MRHTSIAVLALAFFAVFVVPVRADEARDATRERVRATLDTYGPSDAGIAFHQSEKQPYNFAGALRTGLKNAASFEVVVSVSDKQTIAFRAYPHYKGGYINLGHLAKAAPFMRQLLKMNDTNFMFWGADDTSDVFAGYEITLESGYPEAAVRIVLQSIRCSISLSAPCVRTWTAPAVANLALRGIGMEFCRACPRFHPKEM